MSASSENGPSDLPLKDAAGLPKFDDNDDRRAHIVAASVVGLALAILSTIGRVAARRRVRAGLKADDYLIFLGTFMAVGVVASTIVMVHFGLGRHINMVTDPPGLAQSVVAAQILYSISVIPIKLSILALYHRLFPSPNLKRACYTIGAVTVGYSVALAVCMGLQCIPLESIWKPDVPGKCIKADAMYTVMAVVNVLTDFAILSLPLPYIWRLSLQKARKVQLIAVFLLGALVCAFGIIRAVAVGTASTYDQSWSNVDGGIWSAVEICIGVLSANLPCLRPLFFWLPTAIRGSSAPDAKYAKKGQNGYGSNSNKRQSAHVGAFEMARRSRIVGGGYEDLETGSDTQPLAKGGSTSNESAMEKAYMPSYSRSASRFSERDMVAPQGFEGSRGGAQEVDKQGIVVETRIETKFEAP